jgi:hypothetical protein
VADALRNDDAVFTGLNVGNDDDDIDDVRNVGL